MSLGGQGLGSEASTQQLVYGPDGRVYGSPGQARAAGVNQYYSEDGTPYAAQQGGPVGAAPSNLIPRMPNLTSEPVQTQIGPQGQLGGPAYARVVPEPVANEPRMMPQMPTRFVPEPVANEPRMMPDRMPQMPMAVGGGLGGLLNNSRRTGVSPLQPSYAPFGGKGGSNSYSQSMGQMGYGSDPYSQIMSQMPIPQNPYGRSSGGALGGYDPSLYNNAFMGSNSRLNLTGLIGGGGMGGGGGGGGSDATTNPFSNMTQAERAAYYAANPTMASVTRGLQGLFGNTLYGKIQNYFDPNFVTEEGLIAMGVNPATYQAAKESFRASEISDMNSAAEAAQVEAGRQAAQESFRSGEIAEQNQINNSFTPSDSPSSNTPSSDSGFGTGDSYGNSDYGGFFNQGGLVTNVFGPNPAGPDDGAGMLQLGEYVIKKSAVKKYGQGLLDMINDGKIPAKKIKSLLG